MPRIATLLLLFVLPGFSNACSVPVFRYALERWELSPYEFTVFYEKLLPPQIDKTLRALEAGDIKANVLVTRVDLSSTPTPDEAKLWARQPKEKTSPWLIVRRRDAEAALPDAFAGPLTESGLRSLLDSPARRQLVEKLSNGTTAVFLFIPGPKEEANAKARTLLETELPQFAKRVQLPEQSPEGPQIRSGVPLKVEFALVEVKRDDPAEQAFMQMLLRTELELSKVHGPIVFPVFGRGRVPCSVFGDDLTKDSLAGIVRFICGECSCTLKELNPGNDLLIAADWHAILEKAGPATPPGKTGLREAPAASTSTNGFNEVAATNPTGIETTPNEVVAPTVSESTSIVTECCPLASHPRLVLAIAGAGLLVLVSGAWVMLQRK